MISWRPGASAHGRANLDYAALVEAHDAYDPGPGVVLLVDFEPNDLRLALLHDDSGFSTRLTHFVLR